MEEAFLGGTLEQYGVIGVLIFLAIGGIRYMFSKYEVSITGLVNSYQEQIAREEKRNTEREAELRNILDSYRQIIDNANETNAGYLVTLQEMNRNIETLGKGMRSIEERMDTLTKDVDTIKNCREI